MELSGESSHWRRRWGGAFCLALALGLAAGWGTKWLHQRPRPVRLPESAFHSGDVRDPVRADALVTSLPPEIASGTARVTAPPAQSLEGLVELVLGHHRDSTLGRVQLELALRETTVDQLDKWLRELWIDEKRDPGFNLRRALYRIRQAIVKRWATMDPLGMIDRVADWRPQEKREVMGVTVSALAENAQHRAQEIFQHLPEAYRSRFLKRYCQLAERQEGGYDAVKAFLEKHASNDAERAWWDEWIKPNMVKATLPTDVAGARLEVATLSDQHQEDAWRAFYGGAMARFPDPVAALREAVRQGIDQQEPPVRLDFMRRLAARWSTIDLKGAIEWATQLGGEERKQILDSIMGNPRVIRSRDSADPFELAAIVDALPDSDRSPNIVVSVAQKMLRADPVKAAEWFLSQPESKQGQMPREMVGEWAKADPASVTQYVRENPGFLAELKGGDLSDVATAMSHHNRRAALEFAGQLADDKQRSAFSLYAVRAWAREDWRDAQAFVDAEPDLERKKTLLSGLLGTANSEIPQEEVVAWAQGLEQPLRDHAMQRLVMHQSIWKDADSAAELAIEWLRDIDSDAFDSPGQAGSYLAITALRLTQEDPRAAVEWVTRLPDEAGREIATRSVAAKWIQFDPLGASEWIATMPDGETRDQSITSLIPALADDSATAFQWALAMRDPEAQSKQAASVLVDWWQRDAGAAEAALGRSILTDTQKAAIAKQLENLQPGAQPKRP